MPNTNTTEEITVVSSPTQRISERFERAPLECMLSFREAQAYLRTSRTTLNRWVTGGHIKAGKVGVRWKFFKSDLDAAIKYPNT